MKLKNDHIVFLVNWGSRVKKRINNPMHKVKFF